MSIVSRVIDHVPPRYHKMRLSFHLSSSQGATCTLYLCHLQLPNPQLTSTMSKVPMLTEGSMLAVGRHKIQIANYLSEGGFSKIYKVKVDPPIDNQIAEACLKQVVVPDKNALEVLRKEVEVMKTLKGCRNIVNLFDSNAERQEYGGGYQVLMLMELCPNGSLLDYMNANIETKLQEKEILKIMMDISVAVYELHKKDLVHRDIKVENVLIDHQKRFKLCDFGSTLSYKMPPKNLEEFRTLSHDILYHTTQQYRAPEMIDLYRQLPIDDKADIWALGCFLYKLCYYITPFEATGDLSVLHASFQFYNTPVFSSDLKNLIIIMLQENPVYRPNIVQVIILLAGMLGVEFPSLYVQDFYNNGPYNFHSLHEYQVLKQKELVHQQQLYIQQNARKTNKRIIDPTQFQQFQLQQPQQVPDHLNAHSTLPHQDAMVPNSSIPEKLQKQLHEQVQLQSTPVPLKLANQIATLLLNPTTTTTEVDSKALNNDNKPNTITTTSPIVVTNDDVDSDLDDLTNMDNVEERFPLLDYLKVDAGTGGGAGGEQPADIFTNGAVSSDKGLSSEISTDTPVKTDKSAVVGNVESGNPVIVQPSAKLTAQNLAKNRPDFTSSNAVNKNTSLIVDDIFNTGSPLLKPQPQKTNQSVKSDSSKLLRWSTSGEELNVNDENTTIRNNETLKIATEFLDPNWKVIGIKSTSSTTNEGAVKKLSPEKDILLPKDANPWGLYRSTGGNSSTNPAAAAAQRPLPVPTKHEGLLPEHFNVLSLNDGKEQIMLEQSLIDLDADVNPPSLPQQPNKHVKEVQNSLLDLGVDFPSRNSSATSVTGGVDYGKNSGRSGHKRISSVTAPASFSLQEQVIDFESDNEESSEMNRLSIRNSLKKQGRKSTELVREGGKRKESSERKRKESTEKKRLSFFG